MSATMFSVVRGGLGGDEPKRVRRHRPTPEHAAALFQRFFLNRVDRVSLLAPWGKPNPAGLSDLELWLKAHVSGEVDEALYASLKTKHGDKVIRGPARLGTYTPGLDGKTKFGCIDFDGGRKHAAPLNDPLAAACRCRKALTDKAVPAYLERSSGAKGYHLWVFVDEPVAAKAMRDFLLSFVPSDEPLASGGVADPNRSVGIEVFPKTLRVADSGVGAAVWLPWAFDAKPKGSIFLEIVEESVRPWVPATFETVARAMVEEVASEISAPKKRVRTARRGGAGGATPLDEWKRAALAALPLDDVYREWLTGKESAGWLQCRDPWSPTGDRTPSAGVADKTLRATRGTLHLFGSGENLSVFDFLVRIGKVATVAAAFEHVATLAGVPLPPGSALPGAKHATGSGRPIVQVNDVHLPEIVDGCWEGIHEANGTEPQLFARQGDLVRLAIRGDRRTIEPIVGDWLYEYVGRVADFYSVTRAGLSPKKPPRDVINALIAAPSPELPPLDAIVTTPTFDKNGSLVTEPGYHRHAALYYDPPAGWVLSVLAAKPKRKDVAGARDLLNEMLCDFRFVDEASQAHCLCAFILPFVRRMIDGPTPMHLFGAPVIGSGKSLLSNLVSIVATGAPAASTTVPDDENETRKRITSELAAGREIIVLDNVDSHTRGALNSSALAAVLTTTSWADRLLGASRMVHLPNHATWILTGNNPRMSAELTRRSILCRIDPGVEKPWLREGFRHPNLVRWVLDNRSRLVHAILVIVRNWIAKGQPSPSCKPLGSFEAWSNVVGGILAAAEIPGFLENLSAHYDDVEAEDNGWREFVPVWWNEFGSMPKSVSDLLWLARSEHMLGDVRGTGSDRSEETKFGQGLVRVRERVLAGFKIRLDADKHHKGKFYRLEKVEDEPSEEEDDDSDEDGGVAVSSKKGAKRSRAAERSPIRSPSKESIPAGVLSRGEPGERSPAASRSRSKR